MNKPNYYHSPLPSRQDGTLLISCLLLLIVLTIVSISSFTTTKTQEKMVENSFNEREAFQASEAALKVAEQFISELTSIPTEQTTCTTNCDIVWSSTALTNAYGAKWWSILNANTNESFWTTKARLLPAVKDASNTLVSNTTNSPSQPRFIIEQLGHIPDDLNPNSRAKKDGMFYYRVTARGTGGEIYEKGLNPSQVYLQSIYGKRYN